MQKFIVMDEQGIIESAATLKDLTSEEDRIREDNPNIEGDLIFAEVHHISR